MSVGLKRVLGPVDAGWIVAGSMVGAGIFITPGFVAAHLPGAWPLAAWLIGGIVAICGAAVYAELGARLPQAGGDYRFLYVAYGPQWGFLNGWAAITLTFSAAAAAQTRAGLEYLLAAVPALAHTPIGQGFVFAPLMVLVLTWANTLGARLSGKTTALCTAVPLVGLIGLFVIGLAGDSTEVVWPSNPFAAPDTGWLLAFSLAIIPVFFTYSGWNAAAYLAGEMKDPGRSLARGLLVGTALVTLLYLCVNLALLALVPAQDLAGSERPVADALSRMLGGVGERWLAAMIAIAVLGSANVTLMAGARVYYAMAADGLAPRALTRTNRAGVPAVALWVGGGWSAALALFGDIEELVNWATLAIVLLSSMAVTTLFALRRRDPSPPFRCPGYPVTPFVFLLASAAAAWGAFRYDPGHSLIGLGIIALGIPAYFLARRWFGSAAS